METRPPLTPGLERQVADLRHSSRLLVRALGFMRSRLDGTGCTPAQCHALTELAANGPLTSGELAQLLEVDKSTASRTLSALLRAGLLEAAPDRADQRTRPVRLTRLGRQRVRRLHRSADAQVRDALALLGEEERAAVLRGISLYERALHRAQLLAQVVLRPIEARDEPAMARIIRDVMTEFGAVGCGFSIEDAEVDAMHAAYSAERCRYFVVERDGELIAGGGIAPLAQSEGDDVCELRKMYSLPQARGLGVGQRLLARCLSFAREAGFRTCYLETLRHMHAARALYRKAGFRALDGPMGNTGHFACDDWYALDLQPDESANGPT